MPNGRWLKTAIRGLGRTLIGLLAALPVAAAAAPAPLPVFLSTDVGCEIDDQWPILHLLTDPRFDLRVIASAQAPTDSVPAPPAEVSAATARHIVRDRLQLARPPRVVTGSNQPLADGKTPRTSEAADALLETAASFSPERRLTVLVIGAGTDVASALLRDPTLASRISIVAMGFRSYADGDEFNIKNDPHAWRIILRSGAPLAVGDLDVTARRLSLTREEASALLKDLGPLGAWLLRDYARWYERVTKTFVNFGRPDDPPSWPIWDEIVVGHLLGKTRSEVRPRPLMNDDLKLVPGGEGVVTWITDVDRDAVFAAFRKSIASFSRGKRLRTDPCVTIAREEDACWRGAAPSR